MIEGCRCIKEEKKVNYYYFNTSKVLYKNLYNCDSVKPSLTVSDSYKFSFLLTKTK